MYTGVSRTTTLMVVRSIENFIERSGLSTKHEVSYLLFYTRDFHLSGPKFSKETTKGK